MIAPQASAAFVAAMEKVLDIHKPALRRKAPGGVHGRDAAATDPRDARTHCPAPGRPERHDYEYERCGVCNVFMASEPLAGRRLTKVTERRTKLDWAVFVRDIAANYPDAERITLVMDNLNTHTPGSLYEAFTPEEAKALWDRFEFVYTPKHGSWLNMAEIEILRHGQPVPGPAHRQHRDRAQRGRRLAGPPRPPSGQGQLAIHHQGCTD